ncbi:hypothetical protein ScPMuIL_012501 [Solemya velum]
MLNKHPMCEQDPAGCDEEGEVGNFESTPNNIAAVEQPDRKRSPFLLVAYYVLLAFSFSVLFFQLYATEINKEKEATSFENTPSSIGAVEKTDRRRSFLLVAYCVILLHSIISPILLLKSIGLVVLKTMAHVIVSVITWMQHTIPNSKGFILFLLLILLIVIQNRELNKRSLQKPMNAVPKSPNFIQTLLNEFFTQFESRNVLCSERSKKSKFHTGFDVLKPLKHLNIPFQEYLVYPVFQNSIDRYVNEVTSDSSLPVKEQMKYELVRLSTFSNFLQDSNAYATRLAQAGFYYKGQNDQVSCFSCSVTHAHWRQGDVPLEVHRRISPNCAFMIGTDSGNVAVSSEPTAVPCAGVSLQIRSAYLENINNSSTNSPVRSTGDGDDFGQTSDSVVSTLISERHSRSTDVGQEGVCYDHPKYPRYAVLAIRISSYNGWPSYRTQTPQSLSSAGLFYAGFGDCVRCFFCGGGLRNWEDGDNPWVEHARWYPRCAFVKQCKGESFIKDILNATEEKALPISHQEGANSAGSMGSMPIAPQKSTLDPLASPAVLSVVDMGYSTDLVKEAVGKLTTRGESLTAENLMEYIFSIESQSEEVKQDIVIDPSSIDKSPNVKACDQQMQKDEVLSEGMLNHHISRCTKFDISIHMSLLQENRQLKEQSICKVCMEEDISIVFLPCAHMATCVQCAPALVKCPICRTKIKGTVRAFMS